MFTINDGVNGKSNSAAWTKLFADAPKERNGWTLQLLSDKVIELQIVTAISPQTTQRMLKKQHHRSEDSVLVHLYESEWRVRFGTIAKLRCAVEVWTMSCNSKQKDVDWQFNIDNAKINLTGLSNNLHL